MLGDPVEPNLYLIQPRGIGGCEVHLEARSLGQPALDPLMLMGRVVVHDDVHVQPRGHVVVDLRWAARYEQREPRLDRDAMLAAVDAYFVPEETEYLDHQIG